MGFRRRCSRQTQRRTRCVQAVAQDVSPTHSKLERSRIWRCVPQAATNRGSSFPWVIDLEATVGDRMNQTLSGPARSCLWASVTASATLLLFSATVWWLVDGPMLFFAALIYVAVLAAFAACVVWSVRQLWTFGWRG